MKSVFVAPQSPPHTNEELRDGVVHAVKAGEDDWNVVEVESEICL